MKHLRKMVYLLVVLCFTTVLAQATDCSAIVKQAMAAVQTSCAATGRNQACYGYVSLEATAREGVPNFTFAKAGDLASVADLASLQLNALDSVKNTWGIVLMKLQANLPDTLPGENVTFLMFGDVQITNAVPSTASTPNVTADATALQPMQAFYFKTGIGQTHCAGAPADGLLIQTPKGAGQISLRANNVDIQLGSTAYLQAQPGANMSVKVVEGKGHLTAGGKTVVIPAGSGVNIPIDEDLNASGEPSDPEPYDASELGDLPVDYLPDEIEVAPPADEEEIQQAMDEAESETTDIQAGDDLTDTEITDNSDLSGDIQPTDVGQDQPPDDGGGDSSGE
jgi:hypothetical protein